MRIVHNALLVFFLFLIAILLLVFLKDVGCVLFAFLSQVTSSILRFKILIPKGEILQNLTKIAAAL
jgi:hypothetical protein